MDGNIQPFFIVDKPGLLPGKSVKNDLPLALFFTCTIPMKKTVTLLQLLLALSLCSSAQTRSRLAAHSLYNYNGSGFGITDTTSYRYSGNRGGDLNSRYLSYDNSISFVYDPFFSGLVNNKKSLQSFDTHGNRSVQIGTIWNKAIGAWEDYETNYFYTTADDSLTSQVDQSWNSGSATWDNLARQTITYDAAKNRSSYTLELWKVGAWTNVERFFYTYDASSNLTKKVYQLWDAGAWENNFSDTMTYSTTNKVTAYYNQLWDKTAGAWVYNKATLSTYGTGDLLAVQTETGWDAASSSWYNVQKDSFHYDGKGNILLTDNQQWNGTGSIWENYRRKISDYDSRDNMLNTYTQLWDAASSSFSGNNQHTYTYDASDHMMSDVLSNWNAGVSAWDSSIRYTYRYNTYGQRTFQNYEDWDAAAGMWTNRTGNQRFHYYYEDYSPTSIPTASAAAAGNLYLFPVPANAELNISLNWDEAQAFSARITDLQGRVYRQWSHPAGTQYQEAVPTTGMSSGVYFIECRGSKGGSLKQSFIVQH